MMLLHSSYLSNSDPFPFTLTYLYIGGFDQVRSDETFRQGPFSDVMESIHRKEFSHSDNYITSIFLFSLSEYAD